MLPMSLIQGPGEKNGAMKPCGRGCVYNDCR